jgi:predicted transglutaminase-like protease
MIQKAIDRKIPIPEYYMKQTGKRKYNDINHQSEGRKFNNNGPGKKNKTFNQKKVKANHAETKTESEEFTNNKDTSENLKEMVTSEMKGMFETFSEMIASKIQDTKMDEETIVKCLSKAAANHAAKK